MKISIKSSFERDAKKLSKTLQEELKQILLNCSNVENITEIKNLKKLSGSKNAFRIRFQQYRIGFYLIDNELVFCKVLHRKDIYDYFPE